MTCFPKPSTTNEWNSILVDLGRKRTETELPQWRRDAGESFQIQKSGSIDWGFIGGGWVTTTVARSISVDLEGGSIGNIHSTSGPLWGDWSRGIIPNANPWKTQTGIIFDIIVSRKKFDISPQDFDAIVKLETAAIDELMKEVQASEPVSTAGVEMPRPRTLQEELDRHIRVWNILQPLFEKVSMDARKFIPPTAANLVECLPKAIEEIKAEIAAEEAKKQAEEEAKRRAEEEAKRITKQATTVTSAPAVPFRIEPLTLLIAGALGLGVILYLRRRRK